MPQGQSAPETKDFILLSHPIQPAGLYIQAMLNKLYRILSKPYVVIIVMIIAPILSLADRNFGYFFGLFIALFLLWKSGWNWARFGFGQRINVKTILGGLLLAIGIFVVVDVCIQPFLEIYFGEIDLSSIEEIRAERVRFKGERNARSSWFVRSPEDLIDLTKWKKKVEEENVN